MSQRDESIDVFKGLLVFGMVFSHVLSLISDYERFPANQICFFTGLITFSGFMFSFGYASQIAYFGKDLKHAYRRMLLSGLKPLIAFYISGFYFRAFVDKRLNWETISNIILLNDIPPFSEFLVSFSLTVLLSLLLFRQVQALTEHKPAFWTVFVLLLLTTFVPYQRVSLSQLALFIGTDRFPTFPVLQYLPLYLLGIYFAKYKIRSDRTLLMLSAIGPALLAGYCLKFHSLPSRFPPSFVWIASSIFFVYLYFLVARKLVSLNLPTALLQRWGRNVLFYLLISNLIIFTFRGAYERVHLLPIGSLGITWVILLLIHYLTGIVSVPKPARQR